MNKISEIKNDIICNKLDMTSLLLKSKDVAVKEGHKDFYEWIEKELNGYAKRSELPDYRNLPVQLMARFPSGEYYRANYIYEYDDMLNQRPFLEPISQIVLLSKSDKTIIFPFPSELLDLLYNKNETEGLHYPCYYLINPISLVGVVERVRNRLMNWLIKLEDVSDESGENTMALKNNDASLQGTNITNYGQVIIGDISNSPIISGNNNEVINNDYSVFEQLVEELTKIVEKLDLAQENNIEIRKKLLEIETAIKDKEKPSVIEKLFGKVKDFAKNHGLDLIVATITKMSNFFI